MNIYTYYIFAYFYALLTILLAITNIVIAFGMAHGEINHINLSSGFAKATRCTHAIAIQGICTPVPINCLL